MILTNTVALITGGKRIGAVVARELAARGVDVAISYGRSQAEAEQAVDAVCRRRAGAARRFRRICRTPRRAPPWCRAWRTTFGRLDILINMASVYGSVRSTS